MQCPWYVTAHAVRKYQAAAGRHRISFDDASDELIEYAAETWRRYLADPSRRPRLTRTGVYQYRGPAPLRLALVVVMEKRDEGVKPQLVDVLPTHAGLKHGRSRQG